MFIDGAYRILYIDLGDGYLPISCLTSHSFNEDSETISTTTRANGGWETSLPTNQSYSISFDALLIDDIINNSYQTYYNLKKIKRDRVLINWKIDEQEYGTGFITSLSDENTIDENVSFSGEIIGYGEPTLQFDYVYDNYVANSIANGSVSTNDNCLKKYISEILK